MDALSFIDKAAKSKPQPVYVLHADEVFLELPSALALDALLLGDADAEFARTVLTARTPSGPPSGRNSNTAVP